MLWQHDMSHDRTRTLVFLIGDLMKARNIDIGLLLLAVIWQFEQSLEGQFLPLRRIRRARHRAGKCFEGAEILLNPNERR